MEQMACITLRAYVKGHCVKGGGGGGVTHNHSNASKLLKRPEFSGYIHQDV